MIPQQDIDRVLEAADIVKIIGQHVTLKKRGVNYIGCCPFHDEKTPSFTVSPAKGLYKCFGCGEGGKNPAQFLMAHMGYSFPEAIKELAKDLGITITETYNDQQEKRSEQELYRLEADKITRFLQKSLEPHAAQYLRSDRGFTLETIQKWQIGHNPDAWQHTTNYAQQQGMDMGILQKMGYLGKGKTGNVYDRLKGRIIFPIHDIWGKVIGFNARVIGKADGQAKYINSSDNLIFDKSNVLFGLHFAKKAIQKADNCILVEGPTDVISMHQREIENVVASNGTALTKRHLKNIGRFTHHLTIMTDGDNAGQKATEKNIALALEQGFIVDVVQLPEGEDPDNICKKYDAQQIYEIYLSNKVDFIDYKVTQLIAAKREGAVQEAEVIRQMVDYMACVPDALTRESYIKRIAKRTNVSANLLKPENAKLNQKLKEAEKEEAPKEALWPLEPEVTKAIENTGVLYLYKNREDVISELTREVFNSQYVVRIPNNMEVKKIASTVKKVIYKEPFPEKFHDLNYGPEVETLKLLFSKGVEIELETREPEIDMNTGDLIESAVGFYDQYVYTLIFSIEDDKIGHLDTAIEKIASITAHLSENARAIKIQFIKDMLKNRGIKISITDIKKNINAYLKNLEKKNTRRYGIGDENMFDLTEEQQKNLRNYGLYAKENCLFFETDNAIKKYSNFTISPVLHTISSGDAKKVFELVNTEGQKALITITTVEMNNLNKFLCSIEEYGNFVFKGENQQLKKLKYYLYDNTTYSHEIETFGWQRDGFWAWANGVYHIDGGKPILADEYGLIKTTTREGESKNYYFKPASKQYLNDHKMFVQQKKFKIKEGELSFTEWTDQLISVYGEKAQLSICALFTTLFGDFIFSQLGNLPMLNLFGPKGTGKTEHAKSILSIFGDRQEEINLTKVTPFAASHSLSMFSNAFIIFDEYKNNLGSQWIEFLKSIYNRQGRVKGHFKEGSEIVMVPVNSMVFICGQEMPTADVAAFSRCVFISNYNVEHTQAETEAYNKLKEMDEMGKTHFVKHLLTFRPLIEESFTKVFFAVQSDLKKSLTIEADDRIIRNYATLLSTFKVLEEHVDVSFEFEHAKVTAIKCIKEQMDIMNSSNEIGHFWSILEGFLDRNLISTPNNIKVTNEVEIEVTRKKDGENVTEIVTYPQGKELLYLRWSGLYQLYAEAAARARKDIMPEKSVLHYLEHSKAYIGKRKNMRFGKVVTTAMLFDHQALKPANFIRDNEDAPKTGTTEQPVAGTPQPDDGLPF